ncbi:MAG: class I SAM-dependent methyltransferase [Rhabdochlamydiaceae bacterium]
MNTLGMHRHYSFSEALFSYRFIKERYPDPDEDGRVRTLNKKGAMFLLPDPATEEFIARAPGKKVLEIGGAYGQVMQKVIEKKKTTIYHLNDLDHRHLFIAAKGLYDRFEEILTTTKFIKADITKDELLPEGGYDMILVARVLHFFSPSQLKKAIKKIYKLLKPGGSVHGIALTPYVGCYKRFIPEYEKRKNQGFLFPGYVASLASWFNGEGQTALQKNCNPKGPFMFLDDAVLSRVFTEEGFMNIRAEMVPTPCPSICWALDHRENVVVYAQKPMI